MYTRATSATPSPSCCLALGSDPFLCVPFPAVDVQEPHRFPSARRNFPVVQDWEPVLLAAGAKLDDWEAALQELPVPCCGLPQRCSIASALFDNLVAILWDDTAKSVHPRLPDVPRHRRWPGWWTDACFHALVARNAAWRDFRRSNLSEDCALFSSRRLHFHLLIRTTRRRFWRSWQDDVARLRTQDPQACASRIRRCFRLPGSRRTPHALMLWRSASVGSGRACDHWRTHFSSVASFGGDDFFFRSMIRRFFGLTANVSPGLFDAPSQPHCSPKP